MTDTDADSWQFELLESLFAQHLEALYAAFGGKARVVTSRLSLGRRPRQHRLELKLEGGWILTLRNDPSWYSDTSGLNYGLNPVSPELYGRQWIVSVHQLRPTCDGLLDSDTRPRPCERADDQCPLTVTGGRGRRPVTDCRRYSQIVTRRGPDHVADDTVANTDIDGLINTVQAALRAAIEVVNTAPASLPGPPTPLAG